MYLICAEGVVSGELDHFVRIAVANGDLLVLWLDAHPNEDFTLELRDVGFFKVYVVEGESRVISVDHGSEIANLKSHFNDDFYISI